MTQLLKKTQELNLKLNQKYFNCGQYIHAYQNLIENNGLCSDIIVNLGSGQYSIYEKQKIKTIDLDSDFKSLKLNKNASRVNGDAYKLPFKDNSINMLTMLHFLEHIEFPERLLKEFYRVLKPKGKIIFGTPSRYSYIAWIARATPFWFHRFFYKLKGFKNVNIDVWPTFYKFNDVHTINRLSKKLRFKVEMVQGFIGEPCYTDHLPFFHLFFILLHKIFEFLKLERFNPITIIGVITKPDIYYENIN